MIGWYLKADIQRASKESTARLSLRLWWEVAAIIVPMIVQLPRSSFIWTMGCNGVSSIVKNKKNDHQWGQRRWALHSSVHIWSSSFDYCIYAAVSAAVFVLSSCEIKFPALAKRYWVLLPTETMQEWILPPRDFVRRFWIYPDKTELMNSNLIGRDHKRFKEW